MRAARLGANLGPAMPGRVTGTVGLPESQSFARGQPVAELGCVGGGVGGKGVHDLQLSPM